MLEDVGRVDTSVDTIVIEWLKTVLFSLMMPGSNPVTPIMNKSLG
jgi:hypothetical protein